MIAGWHRSFIADRPVFLPKARLIKKERINENKARFVSVSADHDVFDSL
jgi:hypothetical protein